VKRKVLEKVVKDTNGKTIPPELENEIQPEYYDEILFHIFFEIYKRGNNFFQTIHYYQAVMGIDFDGEDISLLLKMWNKADEYFYQKDLKKANKNNSNNKPKRSLKSRMLGR
jgi:hypothetical protein